MENFIFRLQLGLIIMPNKDHCCVPKCQNNRVKNIADLSFHQFPKDELLRKQWICKIRRDVSKNFKVSH